MDKAKKSRSKKVYIGLWLERSILDRLDEIFKGEDRKRSSQVRLAILKLIHSKSIKKVESEKV